MTYKEFRWACEMLHIQIPTTCTRIRKKYLHLVKEVHPDQNSGESAQEEVESLIRAWEIIKEYCENFKYEFSEAEFNRQYPDEKLRQRFSKDPIWN